MASSFFKVLSFLVIFTNVLIVVVGIRRGVVNRFNEVIDRDCSSGLSSIVKFTELNDLFVGKGGVVLLKECLEFICVNSKEEEKLLSVTKNILTRLLHHRGAYLPSPLPLASTSISSALIWRTAAISRA